MIKETKPKFLKKFKDFVFNRVILITLLSASSFLILTLVDVFIFRKQLNLTGDARSLATIGLSLFVIIFNLFIAKKWLSLNEVGLQKRGILKSLFYSLIFVVFLRLTFFFGGKEVLDKNIVWDKSYLLYFSTYVFLAFQEELMFRGIIFRVWEKKKGFLVALFISSILFGFEHLLYPVMGFGDISISRAVTAAFFGPAFVLIAYRSENLWGLFVSHFLYNISLLVTGSTDGDIKYAGILTMLFIGVYIFSPILIDVVDKSLSKIKTKSIAWKTYLATLFVIFFLLISMTFVLEDLGISFTP